MMIKLWKC